MKNCRKLEGKFIHFGATGELVDRCFMSKSNYVFKIFGFSYASKDRKPFPKKCRFRIERAMVCKGKVKVSEIISSKKYYFVEEEEDHQED